MTQSRSFERTTKPGDAGSRLPVIRAGTFHLYQFFELGDTIDLEKAQVSLTAPATRRQPPPRVRQSDSIQIAQPPLAVELGPALLELAGCRFDGTLRASLYDLGAVALVFSLPVAAGTGWETVADLFAAAQDPPDLIQARFRGALDDLEGLIRPSIERPVRSPLVEDYSLLIIDQLAPAAGAAMLAGDPLPRIC